MVLFAASGIGNGSTFRTIGVIFDRQQAGPVLGWTSARRRLQRLHRAGRDRRADQAGTPQAAMYSCRLSCVAVPVPQLRWFLSAEKRV